MSEPSKLSFICQRLLDENLASIAAAPDGIHDEEVVHDLRVVTKKLRAAWKMVSTAVGEEFLKSRGDALRELSALLAGNRDLAVLVGLSRVLDETHADAPFSEVIEHLEKDGGAPSDSDATEQIITIIEEEKAAWETVRFDSFAAEQNSHRYSVRRSRQKARAATLLALKDSDAEVWHEWRKKVKQLRYQREFLAEIQNRLPGKWDARISALGSRLGDRNDLANLTTVVETLGNHPQLRKAIAMEERELLGNCRRLGRRNLARS